MFKIVLFLTFSVLCVVNTQSDDGCRHSRSYTRVKRGRYPGPPLRFYSRPPMPFPIKGAFSYTPPPFMQDDEPPYPGSRPYKVSKRPTNEGLGDDDISNLVKNLSKQDLDKILEFATDKDKYSYKSQDVDNGYSRPHKRENSPRPTYTKDFYKGNVDTKYLAEKPYEMEFKKYVNFVTEATPYKFATQDERRNPYSIETELNQVQGFYGSQSDGPSPPFKAYTEQDNAPPPYRFGSQGGPTKSKGFVTQDDRPTPYKGLDSQNIQPNQYKPFIFQDEQPRQFKPYGPQDEPPTQYKSYGPQDEQLPPTSDASLASQNFRNPQGSNAYSSSSNPDIPETNEEEKLPPPSNMRVEDFDASYTNNVPTVVKADSDSYQVESFGELPLMDYNSKLHSVSSYHVPHYTVTQSKSQSLPSPPSSSYASSQSYSSSTGLKPSPAAAHIKAPPVEPAPPASAAKEQSDAHLKAIKIWSHRSKGAAYTLHDDGTLTPEWPRPPKYGK